jgi:hypothetical protein
MHFQSNLGKISPQSLLSLLGSKSEVHWYFHVPKREIEIEGERERERDRERERERVRQS